MSTSTAGIRTAAPRRPWRAWALLVAPAALLMLATLGGPLSTHAWVAPHVAFWGILALTLACAVTAAVALTIGWRRRLAEVAILGAAFLAASVLPMVHGLTTPGVLYDDNAAVAVSAFLAVPVTVLAALPILIPAAPGRRLARRWRAWSVGVVATVLALATFLLSRPDAIAPPPIGGPLAIAGILLSLGGMGVLSARHMGLYRIGGRPSSLGASAGFLSLGLSTLVWLVERPYSAGWWLAHLLDAAGVLGVTVGLAIAHRRDRSLASILAPILNRDPLIALELGLTPTVHGFVADLEQKDLVTRDHVVRVGELAMRVGVRAGLGPERLRALGLGALLHDVGKLTVPDQILTKPAALTDAERRRMEEHTIAGEALMRTSPTLAPAAHLVRWHHERADGAGYPDGLHEAGIPVEARIISVCDAWDAMTATRPYRAGMDPSRATAILIECAGSQWSTAAVALVIEEIAASGTPTAAGVFGSVGREPGRPGAPAQADPVDACLPAAALTAG